MQESQEVLRLLGARHVHDLSEYRQHLIAAICVGWSPKTIAVGSGTSERTAYRQLQELARTCSTPQASRRRATSCAPGPNCRARAARLGPSSSSTKTACLALFARRARSAVPDWPAGACSHVPSAEDESFERKVRRR